MLSSAAKVFECVPNVSEGRDGELLDACARAIRGTGVTLAHRTADPIHNRSVFTFFGDGAGIGNAALALCRVASFGIDLRRHRGAHPRIGALDVLPFVPLGGATCDDAISLARQTATRIWEELRIPSFFYGKAALSSDRTLLAEVRRGEFEGLAARRDGPDVGTVASHPTAGAIAIGVRDVLVAFNVVLATGDPVVAKQIARAIRERSGGLRTVRALGIALGDGRVQVSCNLTDVAATPLDRIVAIVRALAAARGVAVEACELIGLLPRFALNDAAQRLLGDAPPSS